MTVKPWPNETLEQLASTVVDVKNGFTEIRDSIIEVGHTVERLSVTTQALLQIASQKQQRMDQFEQEMELMKQQQDEDLKLITQIQSTIDQTFHHFLEEIRSFIRGNQEK